MCSYNKVNGPYACGNSDTQNTILRGELGFKGFITSDWGGNHASDFITLGLRPGDARDCSDDAGSLLNAILFQARSAAAL